VSLHFRKSSGSRSTLSCHSVEDLLRQRRRSGPRPQHPMVPSASDAWRAAGLNVSRSTSRSARRWRSAATIHERSRLRTQELLYPDLAQGLPAFSPIRADDFFATGGIVAAKSDYWARNSNIRITRIHMEEDRWHVHAASRFGASKLRRPESSRTPLIETRHGRTSTAKHAGGGGVLRILRELWVAIRRQTANGRGQLRCAGESLRAQAVSARRHEPRSKT